METTFGISQSDLGKIHKDQMLYHFLIGGLGIGLSVINIFFSIILNQALFFFERGIYNEIEETIKSRNNPKLEGSARTHIPVTQMHILRERVEDV
jgi:hypothetical protein